MPAESKPVKKDGTWSWRKQVRGHQLYVSGHPTKAAAEAAMQKELKLYGGPQPPFGKGPFKTTVAEALFAFAKRHLPLRCPLGVNAEVNLTHFAGVSPK